MLIFAKSAYMPNAVAEGRNNAKAFGFNAHAEGMNGVFVVVTTIKTTNGTIPESYLDRIIRKNRRNE